jgi:hypothetical protein
MPVVSLFHFPFRPFFRPVAGPAPLSSGAAARLPRDLRLSEMLDSNVRLPISVRLSSTSVKLSSSVRLSSAAAKLSSSATRVFPVKQTHQGEREGNATHGGVSVIIHSAVP